MSGISNIIVSINLEGQKYEVGELVQTGKKIYFRYHSDFLQTGLNLSPIKLPFSGEINSADNDPFDGLYGLFNDSLPDGWGRLLLDRALAERSINISQITPLDRLAHIGSCGMGALTYQPQIESDQDYSSKIELDIIAREMNHILQGTSSDIIEELYALGGSSGGARPKILIAYNSANNEIIHGKEDLPEGFENWIIKFPSSFDDPEIARIEYAYHKIAVQAGINMSECKLFKGESGQVYFGAKRFDRIQNQRLHVHTASGLMQDNFRASMMDYGHLMDCAFRLERDVKAYEKIFRLAVFNVFAHNKDDHSKNFSFLMNAKGEWHFSPAYDLTFSNSSYGFHSTMVSGESRNPGRAHLMKLARHYELKNGETIIEEVQDSIASWENIARECGIGKECINRIQSSIEEVRRSSS